MGRELNRLDLLVFRKRIKATVRSFAPGQSASQGVESCAGSEWRGLTELSPPSGARLPKETGVGAFGVWNSESMRMIGQVRE
jgi:hypothetical protein